MSEIRKKIEQKFAGIEVKAINIGMVESEEAPIEIFLSSSDTDLLMEEARRLKEAILVMPGAKDPTISTDDITPEIKIELDREKMGQLGLPIAVVEGASTTSDFLVELQPAIARAVARTI